MPLIGTLTSGVSAVRTFSKGLEVIGANIANVNTTAYKSSSISYSDTFSNTLRAASATDSGVQIGTGVQVSGISTNYTGGPLVSTGRSEDLGISGSGYFVVQDNAGNRFATRDGSSTARVPTMTRFAPASIRALARSVFRTPPPT
jgi:flagellar hook protein FlgE